MKLNRLWLKFVSLFLSGLLSVIVGNQWVTAQPAPTAPQIQPLNRFNFNAVPFIPEGLNVNDQPGNGRGIIGNDDRIPMTSSAYPWSAIGRIDGLSAKGETYICTGALIAPNIVLTNAHCVYDPETHEISQAIRFMPNLVNGQLQDEDDATFAIDAYAGTDFRDQPEPPNPNDWAVLKLENPIGNKYGTLGIAELSPETLAKDYQEQLMLPGYSFDYPEDNPSETAGVDIGCSVLYEADNVLVHNCDMRGGASGGPILAEVEGEIRIVAVNSAEFANPDTGIGEENYGVPMTRIMAAVRASQP